MLLAISLLSSLAILILTHIHTLTCVWHTDIVEFHLYFYSIWENKIVFSKCVHCVQSEYTHTKTKKKKNTLFIFSLHFLFCDSVRGPWDTCCSFDNDRLGILFPEEYLGAFFIIFLSISYTLLIIKICFPVQVSICLKANDSLNHVCLVESHILWPYKQMSKCDLSSSLTCLRWQGHRERCKLFGLNKNNQNI